MGQRREVFRIPIVRTGRIKRVAETVSCEVVNLSEKGFRLRTAGSFVPNEVLQLEFALSEHEQLTCTVQVIYAQPPFLGAAVTAISPYHQVMLTGFIDQVNVLHMAGF